MQTFYLHGFASSPNSFKAKYFAQRLLRYGIDLSIPDLNVPSAEKISVSNSIQFLNKQYKHDTKINIIGSSLGGYTAALYASLYPERVNKLVLMAPAFNLAQRWRIQLGNQVISKWEQQGFLTYAADKKGNAVFDVPDSTMKVWHRFLLDLDKYAPYPQIHCETVIIHGENDVQVPIEESVNFCKQHPSARLIRVQDDHLLLKSLSTVEKAIQDTLVVLI